MYYVIILIRNLAILVKRYWYFAENINIFLFLGLNTLIKKISII